MAINPLKQQRVTFPARLFTERTRFYQALVQCRQKTLSEKMFVFTDLFCDFSSSYHCVYYFDIFHSRTLVYFSSSSYFFYKYGYILLDYTLSYLPVIFSTCSMSTAHCCCVIENASRSTRSTCRSTYINVYEIS